MREHIEVLMTALAAVVRQDRRRRVRRGGPKRARGTFVPAAPPAAPAPAAAHAARPSRPSAAMAH